MTITAFIPIIGSIIDPIGRVAVLIAEARNKSDNAKTAQSKLVYDERLKSLESRRDVLMRDPYGPTIRAAYAIIFLIYTAKLILWDKVLGWGSTDPLSAELSWMQVAIVTYYFLTALREKA